MCQGGECWVRAWGSGKIRGWLIIRQHWACRRRHQKALGQPWWHLVVGNRLLGYKVSPEGSSYILVFSETRKWMREPPQKGIITSTTTTSWYAEALSSCCWNRVWLIRTTMARLLRDRTAKALWRGRKCSMISILWCLGLENLLTECNLQLTVQKAETFQHYKHTSFQRNLWEWRQGETWQNGALKQF